MNLLTAGTYSSRRFTIGLVVFIAIYSFSRLANASCTLDVNGTIVAGSNGDSCTNPGPLNPSGVLNPASFYPGLSDGGYNNVTLQNAGLITGSVGFSAYASQGVVAINSGTISLSGINTFAVSFSSLLGLPSQFFNTKSGSISTSGPGLVIFIDHSDNVSINNAGSIIANTPDITAIGVTGNGNSNVVSNTGTISVHGDGSNGVQLSGAGNVINNSGSITTDGVNTSNNASAIDNGGGTNTSLTNSGIISSTGSQTDAVLNEAASSFLLITNTGSITSSSGFGINNQGTITTLNNAQGGGSPLTYTGNLPQNYNIILGSNSSTYGKLAATSVTNWDGAAGKTNFSIYSGSVKSTKYVAVISGVTTGLLASSSLNGTYLSGGKSYSYSLALESGSSDTWDLLFPTYYAGPSVANTNQSLVNTASALQGTYTLQNSVLANSFSYDCNTFGANNVCVSAGGRNSTVQAANGLNNTSALLIAAYRLNQNYRIGAYADQNLSVNNPGGTVNLGNNTPLIGLFGAWNERLDGTGTEVKVSAAYGQKNTTITRSVVGSGDGASEAGTGSSKLNSQGVQATAKYGIAITDKAIVSPYVGVRYTQNNMNGYTEAASSSVTAPLTYSALNTNATTALAGVGASYQVIPLVTTFASAGVETDTNTANGTLTASNSSIGALTPVSFNANPVRTRPTATLGAYYDIEKNQRVGITGIYRQEAYQAVSTTTVMATYTVGL